MSVLPLLLPLAPMRPALPGSLEDGGAAPAEGDVVVLLEAPELLVPPWALGEPLVLSWALGALLAPMDCELGGVLPPWFWLPAPMELVPPGAASVDEDVPGAWFWVAEGVGVSALLGVEDVVLLDSLRWVVDDEPEPLPDPDEDPCARTRPAKVTVRSPASVGRRTERKGIDAFISGTP